MSALFPRWTNTFARLSLLGLAGTLGGGLALWLVYVRSPLFTGQDDPIEQPIQFDHRHHVGDDRIDCRYCHTTVDKAPSAGYPPTSLCMSCHAQVWNRSPLLDPLRRAYFNDAPLRWNRVHRLPDFVYFNHAIHVNKGVGCVECHGRVDGYALMEQHASLTMGFCLDCHRDPAPHLRPREAITSTTWTPSDDPSLTGTALAERYRVHTRTSCTTCHR